MDGLRKVYCGADCLLTSLGDKEKTLSALDALKTGLCLDEEFQMCTARIPKGHVLAGIVEGCSFFESLVIHHLQAILDESKIASDDSRLRVVLSTTKGNIGLMNDPEHVRPEVYLGNSAERIQRIVGLAYNPVVLSNACISGVSALSVAKDWIQAGECDHVIVVGCDVLTDFIVKGFAAFKSISAGLCMPYDLKREGLNLGEACGAMLLTADLAYAVQPTICLAGCAVTNDANHISGPSRTGDGLGNAIMQALEESCIGNGDVAFINMHGTATLYNDEMESKAVYLSGLEDKPVCGLKGYLGHTLGASGVVETILSLAFYRKGKICGTCGFTECGTTQPLMISPYACQVEGKAFIKTASGFGGCNAAAVFVESTLWNDADVRRENVAITELARYSLPVAEEDFAVHIRSLYRTLGESNMKFYKMSDLCKAAYVAVGKLLQRVGLPDDLTDEDVAVVLANRSASMDADREHQRILCRNLPEGASPAVFVYTLPNVAIGEVCIRYKIRGNNTFFVENADSGLAETYVRLLLNKRKPAYAICGWCDVERNEWKIELKLLTNK